MHTTVICLTSDFKMENQQGTFIFYFRKGKKNAVQARKKLSDAYGEETLKLRQCQNYFDSR